MKSADPASSSADHAGPRPRETLLDEVGRAIIGASPVVITMHANPDGDAAGSAAALAAFVEAHGGEARIASPTPFPDAYAFLLPNPDAVLPHKSREEAAWCRRAGLAVVVDTADPGRIGRIARMIRGLPTVVIDHHPEPRRPLAGLTLIDTRAAAAAELVFEVVQNASGPWTDTIVSAIYFGILTDTGGFRHLNTTPRCLRAAARLIELGANPESLHRAAYSRHSPRRYAMLRESLATLELHPGGRIAWMTVPREAFERLGATVDDLAGFVDVPRDLDGIEVAILFRTTADGRIKVSLRSSDPASVNDIARVLGGGGHRRAAAAVVAGPLEVAVERVVGMVAASLHR